MPITFGAVGDIITVSLLIKDLVKCLDESRGSSAEYQAVIRELWSLDHALLEVELLLRSCKQSVELSGLSKTANHCVEQCRKCISDFRHKVNRYQGALGGGGTGNLVRDTTAKVRWHVSVKDDLAKFKADITAQTLSLNLFLATAGVKLSMSNDEGMHKRLNQIDQAQASVSATQSTLLADMNSRLEETNALIQAATSETKALGSQFDLDYLQKLGAESLSLMREIWRINSMTYNAVAALQARIPAQLDRTWTQDPVTLEDALGRVSRFHLEFIDSWEVFDTALEARFQKLPGHRKIKRKEYALRSEFINKDVDTSVAFNRCFLPGQHYEMSMIFNSRHPKNSCPSCFLETREAADAFVNCNRCGLSYQRIVETIADASPFGQRTAIAPKEPILKRKREVDSENDDEPRHFRRVRMKCRQRARNQNGQGEAESKTLSVSGEGTIRCVCGAQDDYADHSLSASTASIWLIQCLDCNAWQHRSCVGTANGNDPPSGYYCEQCRSVGLGLGTDWPFHDPEDRIAMEAIIKRASKSSHSNVQLSALKERRPGQIRCLNGKREFAE